MLRIISSQICAFRNNESGVVTADFLVLLSTIVLLGLAVVGAFEDEVVDVTNDIANNLAAIEVSP